MTEQQMAVLARWREILRDLKYTRTSTCAYGIALRSTGEVVAHVRKNPDLGKYENPWETEWVPLGMPLSRTKTRQVALEQLASALLAREAQA